MWQADWEFHIQMILVKPKEDHWGQRETNTDNENDKKD